jgi:hypothetical protein
MIMVKPAAASGVSQESIPVAAGMIRPRPPRSSAAPIKRTKGGEKELTQVMLLARAGMGRETLVAPAIKNSSPIMIWTAHNAMFMLYASYYNMFEGTASLH